jgi:very-short-patch-repair endonuclease
MIKDIKDISISQQKRRITMLKKYGKFSWNAGLTKETDERVMKKSINSLGYNPTEETRKKLSVVLKKSYKNGTNNHWSNNKDINEIVSKKISNNHIEKYNSGELKIWNKGLTKHTDDRIMKYSKKLIGRIISQEHKDKLSKINKNNKNSLGHIVSVELRKKLSEVTIRQHQNNKGKYKDTKPELKCEQILKDNNLKYKKQFRLSNRLYDFYLPDYNLLIEVDGIFYHGKNIKDEDLKYDMQKKSRRIDKLKNKLAEDNGFNLLRVWEDEIEQFEKIIKYELNCLELN